VRDFSDLVRSLPPATAGEDESAYFRRMMVEKDLVSVPLADLREAVRTHFKWVAVQSLIQKINTGDQQALSDAVIALLRETYEP
jgi:Zn-dependent M16 (insulinase) family peptidase